VHNLTKEKETKLRNKVGQGEHGYKGRENTRWGLLTLLICLLTIYAPIELSRVIVNWGLAPSFIFELTFMWLFYGVATFIISAIALRYIKQK